MKLRPYHCWDWLIWILEDGSNRRGKVEIENGQNEIMFTDCVFLPSMHSGWQWTCWWSLKDLKTRLWSTAHAWRHTTKTRLKWQEMFDCFKTNIKRQQVCFQDQSGQQQNMKDEDCFTNKIFRLQFLFHNSLWKCEHVRWDWETTLARLRPLLSTTDALAPPTLPELGLRVRTRPKSTNQERRRKEGF